MFLTVSCNFSGSTTLPPSATKLQCWKLFFALVESLISYQMFDGAFFSRELKKAAAALPIPALIAINPCNPSAHYSTKNNRFMAKVAVSTDFVNCWDGRITMLCQIDRRICT